MRITVVANDKLIIVDARVLHFDYISAPANFHALQWQDDSGWLEFNDGTANQALTANDFDETVKPFLEIFQAEAELLDSCPGPAYELDRENRVWVYNIEKDSPGPDYDLIGGAWVRIRYSKKDFLLKCGLGQVVALNAAINAGNSLAKTIHDLLIAAEFIDITDPDTIKMVNLLTTEEAGNILTADQAAEILKGERYVAEA